MVKSAYFPASSLLCLSLSGELGVSQLGILLPDLQGCPAPTGGYDAIVDLSRVTHIECSFPAVATLVRARQARYEDIEAPRRIALWAPDDLPFGICRMLEQVAQGLLPIELTIARAENEAIASLSRPEHQMTYLLENLQEAERRARTASA